MKDQIVYKSNTLRAMRELLYRGDFVELTTPVVRRADCAFRPRPIANLGGRRYLRESVGPALRYNLQFTPRVFEIGPCFREEKPDTTHANEFTMLDLYAAGESMDYLLDLAERLTRLVYTGEIARVSIAAEIKSAFDVDLTVDSEMKLRERLLDEYRLPASTTLYRAVEEYVDRELQPRTRGKCVILHDYPLLTEVCAKRREGAAAILNRFELYLDGVETIHGYEDEDDRPAFVERAAEIGFFNAEQQLIHQEIARARVPARSVGLGVGIERLCMVASGCRDVHEFIFSPGF